LDAEVDIEVCAGADFEVDQARVVRVEERSVSRRGKVEIVMFARDVADSDDCAGYLRSRPIRVLLKERSTERRLVDAGVLSRYGRP
jgi:hypothetical protein